MKLKFIGISALCTLLLCSCSAQAGAPVSGDYKMPWTYIVSGAKRADEKKEMQKENIGLEAGNFAPDFNIVLLNGSEGGTLWNLRGKPTLLNFWATWCGPCVAEMPAIEAIYGKYSDKINIVAVNCSEEGADVAAFIEESGFTFPIALDSTGAISAEYEAQAIPVTFVLDKDGVITDVINGSSNEKVFNDVLAPLLDN